MIRKAKQCCCVAVVELLPRPSTYNDELLVLVSSVPKMLGYGLSEVAQCAFRRVEGVRLVERNEGVDLVAK